MVQSRRAHAKPIDDFCTVAQAAEQLGVSVSTIWRWIESGHLPAVRVGPRAIRIRRRDVQATLQPAGRDLTAPSHRISSDLERARRPLTKEERERGLAALAAMRTLREELRASRKGRPLPDSAALIRAEREKRSRLL
jgi:excisionase family DNA binding protein